MQRRACIASRMLSSSVVSPRQTLRKRPRVTAKTKPSPSISGTAHALTYVCASQCPCFFVAKLTFDRGDSSKIVAADMEWSLFQ